MVDFKIINVPAKLSYKVTTFDENNVEVPDDRSWHRHAVATDYVLAEFLVEKHLVENMSAVERDPALVIMWSQLTPYGQAFVRAAVDKWLRSIDHPDTPESTMVQKLERRWRTFSKANPA